MAFAGVRAAFPGVFEEHLVEVLAPHLIGVRRAVSQGTRESKRIVATVILGFEIRTGLENAQGSHLVEDPKAFEYWQIHRQKRFADVETRMMGLLQRNHLVAAPGQQSGCGTARGAAANHGHVAQFNCRCQWIGHACPNWIRQYGHTSRPCRPSV